MAIKMRRGNFSDLDTSKLVGGEIAVTDNPDRVVVKTNGGSVIKLLTEGSVAADAFANIKVGNTTIEAIGDDTLEFAEGTGVTLTPDTTNKKVTVALDTSNLVTKSSTSGLLKNDGTVDTTTYVPAVSGKGLSANDYTDADKTALQTAIPLEISQLQGSMLTKVNRLEIYSQPTFTVSGEGLIYTPGSLPS